MRPSLVDASGYVKKMEETARLMVRLRLYGCLHHLQTAFENMSSGSGWSGNGASRVMTIGLSRVVSIFGLCGRSCHVVPHGGFLDGAGYLQLLMPVFSFVAVFSLHEQY